MVQTVVDGVPSLGGWMSYAESVATMGAFGAIGGLAFWVVWWVMLPGKPMHATRNDFIERTATGNPDSAGHVER